MKSTEEEVQDALRRFSGGEFQSLREMERETGVNRNTVKGRLNGSRPHKEAHSEAQKLPPAVEEVLA